MLVTPQRSAGGVRSSGRHSRRTQVSVGRAFDPTFERERIARCVRETPHVSLREELAYVLNFRRLVRPYIKASSDEGRRVGRHPDLPQSFTCECTSGVIGQCLALAVLYPLFWCSQPLALFRVKGPSMSSDRPPCKELVMSVCKVADAEYRVYSNSAPPPCFSARLST